MNGALKIFCGSSHRELGERICHFLDTPLGKMERIKFSNENLMIRIGENVRGSDVFVLQTSAPPVNEGIIELLITIDPLHLFSWDYRQRMADVAGAQ